MVNIHIFSCFFQMFWWKKPAMGLFGSHFTNRDLRHATRKAQEQGGKDPTTQHPSEVPAADPRWLNMSDDIRWGDLRSLLLGKCGTVEESFFLRSYHIISIILTHRCHMSIVDCRTAEKRSLAENGCLQTWIVDASINNSCIFHPDSQTWCHSGIFHGYFPSHHLDLWWCCQACGAPRLGPKLASCQAWIHRSCELWLDPSCHFRFWHSLAVFYQVTLTHHFLHTQCR